MKKDKFYEITHTKNTTMWQSFISMLWIIYCIFAPIIIGSLPVIPYIITNNGWWMLLMILTFPIGVGISIKTWDIEYIIKNVF